MRNVYIVVLDAVAVVNGVNHRNQTLISQSLKYSREGNPKGYAVFSARKCAENYIKRKETPHRRYEIIKVSVK